MTVEIGSSEYRETTETQQASMLARSQALLPWLLRRSAGLQSLTLELTLTLPFKAPEPLRAELSVLAEGCLAACGPVLQDLSFLVQGYFQENPPLHDLRPWFLGMRQLRSLVLRYEGVPLRLLVTLGGMGLLERLTLKAHRLTIGTGVALPPALTHLELEAVDVDGALSQVGCCLASNIFEDDPCRWLPLPCPLKRSAGSSCPTCLHHRCRTAACAASRSGLTAPLRCWGRFPGWVHEPPGPAGV